MDLYLKFLSPPCRSVLLTAKALGVNLNLKMIDLVIGDHMTPEFLKINPQHQIPTLNDNGFTLGESRAIMMYLADKYGQNDSLYPKDLVQRALVNSRLFFDMALYQCFAEYWYPQLFADAPANTSFLVKMNNQMSVLEEMLSRTKYAAGNDITLADFALVATISTYEVSGYNLPLFPKISAWYENCKTNMDGYQEMNQKGVDEFRMFFRQIRMPE